MYLSLEEAGLICNTEEWKQKQEEKYRQLVEEGEKSNESKRV